MIEGVVVLKGEIENISPLLIGNGEKFITDNDLLTGSDGIPYIPATSFTGALKALISRKCHISEEDQKKQFWGFTSGYDSFSSYFRCFDLDCLYPDKTTISIRDGIQINNENGIVKEGGKYDYQVVEPGARFSLNLEADFTKETKEFTLKMFATIKKILESGNFHIGAKTNNGLGRLKLTASKFFRYDFHKKKDILNWLKQLDKKNEELNAEPFLLTKNEFTINAVFSLKSSLIIRSYYDDSEFEDCDAVSMKSQNKGVISGSSLKGAVRARSERILNTLGRQNLIAPLFGKVDTENKNDKAIKGKVRIEETTLPEFIWEINNRVKIDRFTGGTIKSALFNTCPVYSDFKNWIRNVKITVKDYIDSEAGLLLLVLKDLWTGDLPVGGEKSIGRGVLKGKKAELIFRNSNEDREIVIKDDFSKLSDKEKEFLADKVEELVNSSGEVEE